MGCSGCSSGKSENGLPKGCKNNGACGVGGCNKLNVFDWLSNMELPEGQEKCQYVEVRFKNTRKEFFLIQEGITLAIGDIVAVEANPGHDIGVISLTGELVKIQMKKYGYNPEKEIPKKIFRKARQKDIDTWQELVNKEQESLVVARKHANELNLEMKISDIEFQGDGGKVTLYYTADGRVDFRELIKLLARDLKTRIDMRQIGSRQEAGRLGGIGSCGRELCCSTWLTDFRTVSTNAARYQQLSINPQKLAGQCGKLKCCLNYELDTYVEALKDFPDSDVKIKVKEGSLNHIKSDVFKGDITYLLVGEERNTFIVIKNYEATELIQSNKKGEIPSIEKIVQKEEEKVVKDVDFTELNEDSITRFDQSKKKKKKNFKRKSQAGSNNG
jgi:cell fate regulator YaaT (PSP1 superfamily)